nr:hydratase [uncultured Anaeromusa sp.]
MIKLISEGTYLLQGQVLAPISQPAAATQQEVAKKGLPPVDESAFLPADARKQTMAHQILQSHNAKASQDQLHLRFDAIASHDITYVGIVQTAMASGLQEFPLPYILTNCHNTLCAVGGTINEDDHLFGLSAAKRFGGIYVPAHQAVIHQYVRETATRCGGMILGSDSHTRYGALGTLAMGEGGGELVKQLLSQTYDVAPPEVIAVYLDNAPILGVGPQDVALTLIGAVFESAFVKNKILEFVGPGVASLSMDFRNGIDVMTTETTCLSSIWVTDEKTKGWYDAHHRGEHYRPLIPGEVSYYDGAVYLDLSTVRPMIALPFHPSNTYAIEDFNQNALDILHTVEENAKEQLGIANLNLAGKLSQGRLQVEQGLIVGCAGGTFENIAAATDILQGRSVGCGEFTLGVYPSSQPVGLELLRQGCTEKLLQTGAIWRTAFCGPCFGAGDTPASQGLSLRHATRNFPHREGSKPGEGQISSVALMDARSIAATALNQGRLTAATEIDYTPAVREYHYDDSSYQNRVYQGFGKAQTEHALRMGPNIKPWPVMDALPENALIQLAAVIHDPVTTTDELIPSGETSSFRSNPEGLSQFTLSRKDPAYVGRAKAVRTLEGQRKAWLADPDAQTTELDTVLKRLQQAGHSTNDSQDLLRTTSLASGIFARRPGDGSAREQAASCQRVLGGLINIALAYATKRYRSNVVNWGMVPFLMDEKDCQCFAAEDYLFLPGLRTAIASGAAEITGQVLKADGSVLPLTLRMQDLTADERDILLAGCLINYYAGKKTR